MTAKRQFVGEALEALPGTFEPAAAARGEPSPPSGFRWRGGILDVARVRSRWRSMKTDRGEQYLARHWFELELGDGRLAVAYFDRHARRGASRWWLYTIRNENEAESERTTAP